QLPKGTGGASKCNETHTFLLGRKAAARTVVLQELFLNVFVLLLKARHPPFSKSEIPRCKRRTLPCAKSFPLPWACSSCGNEARSQASSQHTKILPKSAGAAKKDEKYG
ncbi:MAG: hypothetical protein Q4A13_09020, partial [Fretibacterium sp.]|nr:hypothetical protein [Fretibacterium sp.]